MAYAQHHGKRWGLQAEHEQPQAGRAAVFIETAVSLRDFFTGKHCSFAVPEQKIRQFVFYRT